MRCELNDCYWPSTGLCVLLFHGRVFEMGECQSWSCELKCYLSHPSNCIENPYLLISTLKKLPCETSRHILCFTKDVSELNCLKSLVLPTLTSFHHTFCIMEIFNHLSHLEKVYDHVKSLMRMIGSDVSLREHCY